MSEIVAILMHRDHLSFDEAGELLKDARNRVANGEDPEEILFEDFGLEPDYIWELLP